MTSDPVLEQVRSIDPLKAAGPWTGDADGLIRRVLAAGPRRTPAWRRGRVRVLALTAVAMIAIPAAAFADTIGGLLGISNQGTTVAASDTPFSNDPDLYAAIQHVGLTTMQFLGARDDVSFYAARNPEGHFCFAISSAVAKGVGCRLDNAFPSTQDPLIDMFSSPLQIAGFADDDVSTIAVLDSSGNTLATIPVNGNIYALADPPAGAAEIEALDAGGNVVVEHSIS